MTKDELADIYRGYIDCLNRHDTESLANFVHEKVHYNGEEVGLTGYQNILKSDFAAIPDLYFNVEIMVSDPPHIASRLHFDCTPTGALFEMPVNGKRIQFDENVFYEFNDNKIERVRSIIDKAAIAAQIDG